jgi:hypothetical protein
MAKFARINNDQVADVVTAETIDWCYINPGGEYPNDKWVKAPDDIKSKEYTWDAVNSVFVENN